MTQQQSDQVQAPRRVGNNLQERIVNNVWPKGVMVICPGCGKPLNTMTWTRPQNAWRRVGPDAAVALCRLRASSDGTERTSTTPISAVVQGSDWTQLLTPRQLADWQIEVATIRVGFTNARPTVAADVLPFQKVGGRLRFNFDEVVEWANQQ